MGEKHRKLSAIHPLDDTYRSPNATPPVTAHPDAMSSKLKDLQLKVSSLSHELELTTLLNKGALQTNSESKLLIAELGRENAALRVAESRLTQTENALEAAERRIADLASRRQELDREVHYAREHCRRAERERDEWKNRFERIGGMWNRMESGWEEVRSGMKDLMRDPAPRLSPSPEMDEQPPASTSTLKVQRQLLATTPSSPVTLQAKKRRRVQETPADGDEDDGKEDNEQSPSLSPPPRTTQPAHPKRKERKSLPHPPQQIDPPVADTLRVVSASSAKKRSSAKQGRKVSEGDRVKVEALSPAPERFRRKSQRDDSDDDPLAMA